LTGASLAATTGRVLGDRARLEAMRVAMRRFAQPDAAAIIVDRLAALAGWPGADAA
jgi:hypothetical protein